MSKGRRALRIIAVNLAVTCALLVAAELACRHVERVKNESLLPANLRKLPPKGPSELRVFAFGGSTVYGVPVPEVAWVAQIQYWLKRLYPDRDIRVYNFGMQGVDTPYVLREVTQRLDEQPDLLIVITGHNEFLGRDPNTPDLSARVQETLAWRFATFRMFQWGVAKIERPRIAGQVAPPLARWNRESAYFKIRVAEFQESLEQIAERARERHVKLILGTLPSNLADWPPVHKRLLDRDQRYTDMVAQIQELLRDGKNAEASEAVKAGFALYGNDAMMEFLEGKAKSAQGNYGEAREWFIKARDDDPIPLRTSSRLNAIIRQTAAGGDGVYLVDLDAIFQQNAANELVSFDLISDWVHGTPRGESLTAQAVLRTMANIGILPPASKPEEQCCPVNEFLADTGYLAPKSPLRMRALLLNATYPMKTPFLDYDAARIYLLQALQEDPDSWQVWGNLATLSFFTDDPRTAQTQLQRAIELHHAPLNLNDREALPYLKQAMDYSAWRAAQPDARQ